MTATAARRAERQKQRPLGSLRENLLALREGRIDFARFMLRARPHLQARAEYFIRRWPGQTLNDPDDLVQEMSIALWRAVDVWNPELSDIVRWVDSEIGRAAQYRMRRALGYPDKRRVTVPARQVDVPSRDREGELTPNDIESVCAPVPATAETTAVRAQSVKQFRGKINHRFVDAVVALVAEGCDVDEAARVIYADRDERLRLRFDRVEDAVCAARVAVRVATEIAERASG